ncbi:hypothetical protein ESB00_05615 [Oleiharenicola lentus]|uniref:Uncharacterized protein n=1 Tax=Oleiharenicola lentus TaxID=2508720 RepID=A0A4Q1C927_9BACT|nr:hypothetical protein [Oleiharenicola lentus]RXK55376.1 hypothetical protein ESB00_05615 [Oleiharenicola lentus]
MKSRLPFALLGAVLAAALPRILAAEDEITAVSASVYNGYQRTLLADGSFKPELIAFGEGGLAATASKDPDLEGMSFPQIARTLAPALARQGYVSNPDPEKTDLLVMVYWGGTATDSRTAAGFAMGAAPMRPPPPPPRVIAVGRVRVYVPNNAPASAPPPSPDQGAYDTMASMQNRERDRDNQRTAHLLGYGDAFERASRQPNGRTYLDLVDELEDPRYYVILQAYDFRLLWKEKKHRLLWETRFSIRARGHAFDGALNAMTLAAARHFGRATSGLDRLGPPAGEVKLGDPVFKEYLEPGAKP